MMVGREGSLGWCLTNGTALSSGCPGAQVGRAEVLVQRTRRYGWGTQDSERLVRGTGNPMPWHPNLCLPWSARSWILTSGHAKMVGPSSRDLVV